MASFTLGFSAGIPFKGAGESFTLGFYASFPPEAGCIGLGSAAGALTIEAAVTTTAREYLARSVTDGTSLQINNFAVGVGGYDPAFPLTAVQVDSEATSLISEVYRAPVTRVETPLISGIAKSFVCRIGRDDLEAGIGEIGIFATIANSPFPSEDGEEFLFAVAHQPLNAKTFLHVVNYRVVVIF